MRRRIAAFLMTASAALAGCGGGSGVGRPISSFPSRDELVSLAAEKAKPEVPVETVEVERWELQGPVPAPGSTYPTETSWDQRLTRAVAQKGKGARASSELRCAAQEAARLYVEKKGFPDDGLQRFLLLRCGSTLPWAGLSVVTVDASSEVSDTEVEKSLLESTDTMIGRQLEKVPAEIGLGYARGNGRAAVVSYAGQPVAEIPGFSPLISGSEVTLSGRFLRGASFVTGLANQGEHEVRECERDRSVAAPRFRLTCPIAEDDEEAHVEILSSVEGHVLMDVGIQVLLRRSDEVGLVYEPRLTGSRTSAKTPAAFRDGLFEALNQARTEAGLKPLALEGTQSEMNERVTPHFFEAFLKGNQERADLVALGLLAGWDVSGMIRDGSIYSGLVSSSRSPAVWLSQALESPVGRWVLFEPSMTRVAIGASALAPRGLMALVTTYSFFETSRHDKDQDLVFQELTKARKARKSLSPRRFQGGAAMEQALAKIASNTLTSDKALGEALEGISQREQRSVSGVVMETNDLRRLHFTPELLRHGGLDVAIGVTHYKAKGGAWGQFAVLFVIREPNSGQAARARRQIAAR